MSHGGKGSSPRPYSVSQDEYDKRWEAIFSKDKKPAEPEQCCTHDCDQGRTCPKRIERLRDAKHEINARVSDLMTRVATFVIVAYAALVVWLCYQSFEVIK